MEVFGARTSELRPVCEHHRKLLAKNVLHTLCVIYVIISAFINTVACYNLDLVTATIHSGETRSLFGFSVALHEDQGSKWLLVGAPRAQTRQPGVTRGGAVYRCPIDSGSYCQEIPFDTKGNDIRHNGTHYRDVEDKSDQWFGAALDSAANGIIVACAPRYVYFSTRMDKREPVGTCFVARSSSTDYEEYSPCRTRVDGLPLVTEQFHQQGYCQLGFSASLTSQGQQLLIGAVGSWYWQGQLFNFNFEDGPGRYQATPEGRQRDDYSYMGYSSAIGHFDDDDREDYVVGAPKGRQLQGKVVIYTQNLTLIETIRGEQFGSYFGYAVTVSDLDGNGLDDVIIGAPLFSDFSTDNSYETGRVYIFYQNSKRRFSKRNKDILDGHHSRSRFGLSMAALGDIDIDGYNDIAVGAPYGGEDGRGVVYIYHGSMRGIITDVQQAINAESVLPGIETFGWSMSGGLDMDDNSYPDLLIGAQDSNKALFLKSRPVVRVTPSISIDPMNITLDDRNCVLLDGTQVTCITVYSCLLYSGTGVPDEFEFDIKWTLDALKNDSSRVYYLHTESTREESTTVRLFKDKNECFTAFAYLVDKVRDKLTPIVVDLSFSILERGARNKRDVTPILNQRIPTTARAEANILKDCGPDNVCVPDLAVKAIQISDAHLLGDDEKLRILILVENRGEDSYETMLNISLPHGVKYYRLEERKYEIPMFCDTGQNATDIICDLGNPFPDKSRTNFTLVVKPYNVSGAVPELTFTAEVNSSNSEDFTDTMSNYALAKIPIKQAADLNIGGDSTEQVIYTETDVRQFKDTPEIGPVVQHNYILENKGPTAVKTSILKINWPSRDENGRNLLLLTSPPRVSRPDISCILHNDTITTYANSGSGNIELLPQNDDNTNPGRQRREEPQNEDIDKRDVRSRKDFEQISCKPDQPGCTYIHCTIGYLEPHEMVSINLESQIWTSTLIHKKLNSPFYFLSRASAEVLAMPYPNLQIDPSTHSKSMFELVTYVNPERLHPKKDGIEPWIIGVAISAGLLLLLLLIVLLWWCGFFQRKRPEEHMAYKAPAPQNGEYKKVSTGPPDARYQYM